MSKRDTNLLLLDMLDSAKKIKKYTVGLDLDSFTANDMILDAVARNFEIIGEAANLASTTPKQLIKRLTR
ncbi:MAG: DUF86 domain-containing protein [Balneolaceae bacterium]|nr:DUF86 domain-containing protein [Balneolaceae bacterium]